MANDGADGVANWRYDVYISFRGQDNGRSFTGNLYHALLFNRFKVFMDQGDLKSGEQILLSFSQALQDSRIAIVVLSKKYAFSTSCIDELVKIIECKNTKNQLVFPIFYDVDPSDVRHQRGIYEAAMTNHEYWYRDNPEKLQKWRSVLTQVANLSGWHFQSGCQYEYELVQSIVERVIKSVPRFDVFLSFMGKDTRYSFTGHLYNELHRAGFKTFMNDEALEGEDQISPSLGDEIEKSRLSIIVFSENYGYSSCCLDQLVKILECMKMKNQLVWPIFYKVEPADLRHQRNGYGKAMTLHENRFGEDSHKVHEWRSALSEVASLKGWHFKAGYEYEFIERIVENAINI